VTNDAVDVNTHSLTTQWCDYDRSIACEWAWWGHRGTLQTAKRAATRDRPACRFMPEGEGDFVRKRRTFDLRAEELHGA